MKIIYRPHIEKRLIERNIPHGYPRKVLKNPEKNYFDPVNKHFISIKKLKYRTGFKNFVVSYDIINDTKEAITIHPISSSEIKNKVSSGRWLVYEKN